MFRRLIFTSVISLSLADAAHADIRLGIASDLTGPNAAIGVTMRSGAEQAVAAINAKGGLLGEKIAVSLGDDRSDPKEAVSIAQKFISENVKVVIGHLTSGSSNATAKEYAEAGVLMISPSSTAISFTEQGLWNTHRTAGRDDQQGKIAGEYILAHFKNKKIAIIHDKAAYGKGLANETRKTINAGSLKEVIYDGINAGEKDYSALVSRLKKLNADVLYFGGYYPEAGLIVRQMHEQGMKDTLLIGGDGFYNSELGQTAGEGVIGTLFTYNSDPQKNPAAKKVIEELTAKKIDTSSFTLPAYAAVQVFAQAAEDAKSLDPKIVAQTIRSGKTFQTVLGPLSYDGKGDLAKANFVMYEWKKDASGRLVYAEKPATNN